jgi:hypothetical protein
MSISDRALRSKSRRQSSDVGILVARRGRSRDGTAEGAAGAASVSGQGAIRGARGIHGVLMGISRDEPRSTAPGGASTTIFAMQSY